MNNPLWALALTASLTNLAQAQPAIGAGLADAGGTTLAIGKRDANLLGFKGVDELGSGLKALFRRELGNEAVPDASLRIRRTNPDAPGAFASLHDGPAPLAGADQRPMTANRQ